MSSRAQAHGADLEEELALLVDAVDDEADHHEDEDDDGEVAEPGEERRGEFLGDVSEEAAGEEEGLGPKKEPQRS